MYSQWLQTFETGEATISGYESINMIRKGQVKGVGRKDIAAQKKFISDIFGIAAEFQKKSIRLGLFVHELNLCTRAKDIGE